MWRTKVPTRIATILSTVGPRHQVPTRIATILLSTVGPCHQIPAQIATVLQNAANPQQIPAIVTKITTRKAPQIHKKNNESDISSQNIIISYFTIRKH